MKKIAIIVLSLAVMLMSGLTNAEVDEMQIQSRKYNVVIGTQTIGPAYQFTSDSPLTETAKGILEMGSNIIKIREDTGQDIDEVGVMPFDYYFIWFRSHSEPFINGMSERDKKIEYDATYQYAKHLLETYNGTAKSFFIGHWEGDWYLLKNYNTGIDAPEIGSAGMVEWLNVRQAAVDDAKRDVPDTDVKVYHYTEVNRVRDAITGGRKRLVNTVLPYTNVDYVSYSAYDIQGLSQNEINETLDYVQSQLKPKDGLEGKRVFIGEFAICASAAGMNQTKHDLANRNIILKFMRWGTPFILYWEFYNNEVSGTLHKGYWLIDNNNQKWKLYDSFKDYYDGADLMLEEFQEEHGRYPTEQEFLEWGIKKLAL